MTRNINATTIDELTLADLAAYSASTLAALAEGVGQQAETVAARKSKLEAAIERRFSDAMRSAFAAKQTDTGTIHLEEDGYDIAVTVNKTVEWNQTELVAALDALPVEDAKHYAKAKYSIDERKFQAAPPAIQKALAAARAVKPGKPRFAFKPKQSEAA